MLPEGASYPSLTSGPAAWQDPDRLKARGYQHRSKESRTDFPTAIFRVNRYLGHESFTVFHECNLFVVADFYNRENRREDTMHPFAYMGMMLFFESLTDAYVGPIFFLENRHDPITHYALNARFVQEDLNTLLYPFRHRRAVLCGAYLEAFCTFRLWEHSIDPVYLDVSLNRPFTVEVSRSQGIYTQMPNASTKATDMMQRIARLTGTCISTSIGTDQARVDLRFWHHGFHVDAFMIGLCRRMRLYGDNLLRDGSSYEANCVYVALTAFLGCVIQGPTGTLRGDNMSFVRSPVSSAESPSCACCPGGVRPNEERAVKEMLTSDFVDCFINTMIIDFIACPDGPSNNGDFSRLFKLLTKGQVLNENETTVPSWKISNLIILASACVKTGRSLVGTVPYRWKEMPSPEERYSSEEWSVIKSEANQAIVDKHAALLSHLSLT